MDNLFLRDGNKKSLMEGIGLCEYETYCKELNSNHYPGEVLICPLLIEKALKDRNWKERSHIQFEEMKEDITKIKISLHVYNPIKYFSENNGDFKKNWNSCKIKDNNCYSQVYIPLNEFQKPLFLDFNLISGNENIPLINRYTSSKILSLELLNDFKKELTKYNNLDKDLGSINKIISELDSSDLMKKGLYLELSELIASPGQYGLENKLNPFGKFSKQIKEAFQEAKLIKITEEVDNKIKNKFGVKNNNQVLSKKALKFLISFIQQNLIDQNEIDQLLDLFTDDLLKEGLKFDMEKILYSIAVLKFNEFFDIITLKPSKNEIKEFISALNDSNSEFYNNEIVRFLEKLVEILDKILLKLYLDENSINFNYFELFLRIVNFIKEISIIISESFVLMVPISFNNKEEKIYKISFLTVENSKKRSPPKVFFTSFFSGIRMKEEKVYSIDLFAAKSVHFTFLTRESDISIKMKKCYFTFQREIKNERYIHLNSRTENLPINKIITYDSRKIRTMSIVYQISPFWRVTFYFFAIFGLIGLILNIFGHPNSINQNSDYEPVIYFIQLILPLSLLLTGNLRENWSLTSYLVRSYKIIFVGLLTMYFVFLIVSKFKLF